METASPSTYSEAFIERHRNINVEYVEWWDHIYDDFKEKLLERGVTVWNCYFTGFWSQGDGACFEGFLSDARVYLDKCCNADQYPHIRRLLDADGTVSATVRRSGRYYHEYSMSVFLDTSTFMTCLAPQDEFRIVATEALDTQLDAEVSAFESELTEWVRAQARDLYRSLEEEYEHLTSDEAVVQTLEANEIVEETPNDAEED